MTYSANEKSVKDGAPIECYELVSNFGTWLYNDSNEPVTVAGKLFLPLNIERSSIDTSSALDSITTVDVKLPVSTQIAKLYCFDKTPASLLVRIYRVHRGDNYATDYKVIWIGKGIGSAVEDHLAVLKTGSIIQDDLGKTTGTILYQRTCNHVLYDARCKVNKASFTVLATVVKVLGSIVTLDSDGSANGTLIGGQITNNRTGEFYGIVNNVDDVVSSSYPFIDMVAGDTVSLVHGCNHLRLGDCKNKFANVVNYGGMDFIPTVNPFTDLKKQNEAQITTQITKSISERKGLPVKWV